MSAPLPDSLRQCDLVMKGGVTSGVVYPKAVSEIAKAYRFKNIGGTSAGAIAAAAAAAAERGRRSGKNPDSFATLAALPEYLSEPGRLLAMFGADRQTRSLFALVMAALTPRTVFGKLAGVAKELLWQYRYTALLLAIVVVLIVQRWLTPLTGAAYVFAVLATIALAAVVFLVRVTLSLYHQITVVVPDNFYGLSRGLDSTREQADQPLVNFLTGYLNQLAGKPLADGPLTFGDLYNGAHHTDTDAINLEMMTTCLTLGRPFRVPFRDPDRLFYFSEEDFAQFFPPLVVKYMIEHARRDYEDKEDEFVDPPLGPADRRLYGFPDAEHLPVVVATRMSLSFPLLLSAVPLYAVDYSLEANQHRRDGKPPVADRCWFSDGGICSNLPLHFFDAPLTLWPTFAINLKPFRKDLPTDEKYAVWLPKRPGSGVLPQFTDFEGNAPSRLPGFLLAIVTTMQNWQDNTQSRLPGYRERMVHVSHSPDEGGVNLDMPPEAILRLADRGARAGQELVEHFNEPAGTIGGWTDHRWMRFRSTMSLTLDWLNRITKSYQTSLPPDPLLEDLLTQKVGPVTSYRLSAADLERARKAMDDLCGLMARWDTNGTGFDEHAPRPSPDLKIKPRIS